MARRYGHDERYDELGTRTFNGLVSVFDNRFTPQAILSLRDMGLMHHYGMGEASKREAYAWAEKWLDSFAKEEPDLIDVKSEVRDLMDRIDPVGLRCGLGTVEVIVDALWGEIPVDRRLMARERLRDRLREIIHAAAAAPRSMPSVWWDS